MGFTFKSLPPKLFKPANPHILESDDSSEDTGPTGILWLPALGTHSITGKIDWLSGLQISNLQYSPSRKWDEKLKDNITKLKLPLDEKPPFNHENTLLFSLPKGFKSSLGLILLNTDWNSREEVYNKYIAACDSFGNDFFIQSLDFWTTPEIENVDWVKT